MARSKNGAIEVQKASRQTGATPEAAARAAGSRRDEASLAAYAHDIRTALTGILALGELLASSNLGDRERRWASGIKGSAEHLSALTTLMIDAAKADTGTLTLQHEVFRPRRLLEALTNSLSARAETKGLVAEVTVADDLPELLGRRRGAAARRAGKSDRQCGEVHRSRRGAA